MGSVLRFRRRGQPREKLDGPSPELLRLVTIDIGRQAHREVLALRPGQRLIVERHADDRAPFTVIVERMDVEEAAPPSD